MTKTLCTSCVHRPLCKYWHFSMAKCDEYDPIFDVYKTAVDHYGMEEQLNVFHGEIGELMTAVADYRRGRDTKDHVAEELADVLICCKELMYGLNIEQRVVLCWQDKKLHRLATKLVEEGVVE